ncbi:hypothetical protein ACFVSW_26210 [Neobacillus sp. NPDC058068]|uniref:hypothetical protein n=1 Tax=Neobacillus sp. NPDC058068 TaxID=3346325 RepID=UPI0036DC4668
MVDTGLLNIFEMLEHQSIYNPPIEYRLNTEEEEDLFLKKFVMFQVENTPFNTEAYYAVEGINLIQYDQPSPEYMEFGDEAQMEKDKSREMHVKEVYDSINAEDISEVDFREFIEYCEDKYQMSTSVFKEWFESKENEGNIELQLWYMYTRNTGDYK